MKCNFLQSAPLKLGWWQWRPPPLPAGSHPEAWRKRQRLARVSCAWGAVRGAPWESVKGAPKESVRAHWWTSEGCAEGVSGGAPEDKWRACREDHWGFTMYRNLCQRWHTVSRWRSHIYRSIPDSLCAVHAWCSGWSEQLCAADRAPVKLYSLQIEVTQNRYFERG